MAGPAGANLLISWIGCEASSIADGRDMDAFTQLPELALGAPETAHAEEGRQNARRKGWKQIMPRDEMSLGGC